jgi:dihydrofolate synthase / folylpolyglutamate synthase
MANSSALMARFLVLHPRKIDLSLDRMWHVLGALGDPHKRLPPVIHVAGTNGKGSTIAFMRAMLEAAGRRVHVYTSPHLVRFHERIRLSGRLVSEDALADALQRCEDANGGVPITVFEITTAAAFLLFAETPADVLLLEVGLGGQFDATNVIDKPAASVITPVSMDHMDFLGDTIAKIASEKAGIIKRGVPAVFAVQSEDSLAILEAEARRRHAKPVAIGGQDFQTWVENGWLIYQDTDGMMDLPLPRLLGQHQILNAGTAIAGLRAAFGDTIPEAAIAKGLTTVDWPGRLQRLTGKIAAGAPAGSEVWLDGGHNQDGGRVLAQAMRDLDARQRRPLVMIAGMLATKDSSAFFASFKGMPEVLYTIGMASQDAARSADDVAAQAVRAGLSATALPNLEAALARIAQTSRDIPPRILITGSLYLAGEVLVFDGVEPQ